MDLSFKQKKICCKLVHAKRLVVQCENRLIRDAIPAGFHCNTSRSIIRIANSPPAPPRWPSGKASVSRAVRIPLAPGFFRGRVIPETHKIGTPVATLPGAWHYRVSTGTGRPGVSIL